MLVDWYDGNSRVSGLHFVASTKTVEQQQISIAMSLADVRV